MSHIRDPDPGMGLLTAVDADQVGRERLDLMSVAQPTSIDAAHARHHVGQRLHQVGRLAVVAEDQHVGLDRGHLGVLRQHRGHVVEGAGQRPSLRCCSVLASIVRSQVVEAETVTRRIGPQPAVQVHHQSR